MLPRHDSGLAEPASNLSQHLADPGGRRSVEAPQAASSWESAGEQRWENVEKVLSAQDAEVLRDSQASEIRTPEFRAKVIQTMCSAAELRHDSEVLMVLGPSGAGKSYAINRSHIRGPAGSLNIDGSVIRDCSSVWTTAKDKAHAVGLAGFSDYFKEYAQPEISKLKKSIFADAVKLGTNLIVPDTGSDFGKLSKFVDDLIKKGYRIQIVAVFASRDTCLMRGHRRERFEGKKYSIEHWGASIQAIISMQRRLDELGTGLQVLTIDNDLQDQLTSTVSVLSIADLEETLRCDTPCRTTSGLLTLPLPRKYTDCSVISMPSSLSPCSSDPVPRMQKPPEDGGASSGGGKKAPTSFGQMLFLPLDKIACLLKKHVIALGVCVSRHKPSCEACGGCAQPRSPAEDTDGLETVKADKPPVVLPSHHADPVLGPQWSLAVEDTDVRTQSTSSEPSATPIPSPRGFLGEASTGLQASASPR